MLLPHQQYQTRLQNYRLSQLVTKPVVFPISQLTFPRSTIVHYCSFNEDSLGPTKSEPFFDKIAYRIPTVYVVQANSTTNTMRYITSNINILIRQHVNKEKLTRVVESFDKELNDVTKIGLVNYDLLDQLYQYNTTVMSPYYQWLNVEKTYWETVAEYAKQYPDKEHTVIVELNKPMLPYQLAKLCNGYVTKGLYKMANTRQDFLAIELYKLFSPQDREQSVFHDFSKADLEKINLIVTYNGYFASYSLSSLYDKLEKLLSRNTSAKFIYNLFEVAVRKMEASSVSVNTPTDETNATADQTDTVITGDTTPPPNDEDVEDQVADTNSQMVSNITVPNPLTNVTTSLTSNVTAGQDRLQALEKDMDNAFSSDNASDKDTNDLLAEIDKLNEEGFDETALANSLAEEPSGKSLEVGVTHETLTADASELLTYKPPVESLQAKLDKLKETGQMPKDKYKTFTNKLIASSKIPSPFSDKTLVNESIIPNDLVVIKDSDKEFNTTVTQQDTSVLKSTLKTFDSGYLENVMHKDIASVIVSMSNGGTIINDFKVTEETSLAGTSAIYSLEMEPIDGAKSTVHFRLPVIDKDAKYTAGGVKYRMRKQRQDAPIRKIDYNIVALTSYYGKTFVTRSMFKANDQSAWLCSKIVNYSQIENSPIAQMVLNNVFDNDADTPLIYSYLARNFKMIVISGDTYYFDYKTRSSMLPDATKLAEIENTKYVVCGMTSKAKPIVMDSNNVFSTYDNKVYTKIGTIYDLLQLEPYAAPSEFASLQVFNTTIPVGMVLCYYFGLKSLLALTKVKFEIVPPNTKQILGPSSTIIRFLNARLIIREQGNKFAELLFAGLNQYKDQLSKYTLDALETPSSYLAIMSPRKIASRHLTELKLMKDMFVDPMTRQVLETLGEPTEFATLLLKSVDMLTVDKHPKPQDIEFALIKGYERIPGMLYRKLVDSTRSYKLKNMYGKNKISMNPNDVWMGLALDQSVCVSGDINPIEDIKQQEDLTYTGFGGRNKDSLSKDSREFQVSELGIISESTKDSSDVGINVYLTANPSIINLRGIVKPLGKNEVPETAALMSSPVLLTPFAINDSAKRVNFISIQQSHTIACDGYHQPVVRTGYEYMVAKKTTSAFAYRATGVGVVENIVDNVIRIKYEDGSYDYVQCGVKITNSEGQYYRRDIVSKVAVGDTVIKDDVIAYNSDFFEVDLLNPNEIIMKSYKNATVAFMTTSGTLEDSSMVSSEFSEALSSTSVDVRSFVLESKQGIKLGVEEGKNVEPTDVLLYIIEELGGNIEMDDNALQALANLSTKSPKAKIKGTITKIEYRYNGELDDMSASIRKLVVAYNAKLAKEAKTNGKPVLTAQVDSEYRVGGSSLQENTVEVKIYISHRDGVSSGDKVVFGGQMKSVVASNYSHEVVSEDGEKIDAVFSYLSLANRIVLSPILMGTTNKIMEKITDKFISIYNGK